MSWVVASYRLGISSATTVLTKRLHKKTRAMSPRLFQSSRNRKIVCSREPCNSSTDCSRRRLISFCSSVAIDECRGVKAHAPGYRQRQESHFHPKCLVQAVLRRLQFVHVCSSPRPRPERNLDRRSPIRLWRRCQNRCVPFFVLEQPREAHFFGDPPVPADGAVVNCFSSGNKIAGHFGMTICELQIVFCIEMDRRPSLVTFSLTSYPASEDVSLGGVKVVIKLLPIDVCPAHIIQRRVSGWSFRRYRFDSKIQPGHMREARDIDSGVYRGAARCVQRQRI